MHGESSRSGNESTPEYAAWKTMHQRCAGAHRNYGGRGIKVCDRWSSYPLFLADMGRKPTAKHTIERIDNNGSYHPENCRWATRTEQAANTRRSVSLTFNGETHVLAEWSRKTGIPYETLRSRVKAGNSPSQVLRKG